MSHLEPSTQSSLLRRSAEVSIMALEISPVNEVARLGALAASQHAIGGPLSASIAYGGATLLIEGSAAVAAASWLSREKNEPQQATVKKIGQWTEEKIDKIVPRDGEMNLAAQTGTAFLGGTAVLLWAHDRQNPETTKKEKRNFGLKMSAAMAAVCAGQGALMAEGISSPDPKSIGVGLLAFAGVPVVASKVKKRFTRSVNQKAVKDE